MFLLTIYSTLVSLFSSYPLKLGIIIGRHLITYTDFQNKPLYKHPASLKRKSALIRVVMYVLRHLVIHPQNTVVTYPSHVSDMGLGELSQSPIKRRAATTVSYLRVVVLCGIRISFRYDNRVAKYRNNIIFYCVGGRYL